VTDETPQTQASGLVLESVLSCPKCGLATVEPMPTDACIYYYECQGCHSLLKPKPGDCCVFCSYGSVRCPPVQQHANCCGAAKTLAS
jgi:hypothetical protein